MLGEPWETKPQREVEPADQSLKVLILAGDKKLLEVLNIGMTCNLWQSLGRGCFYRHGDHFIAEGRELRPELEWGREGRLGRRVYSE